MINEKKVKKSSKKAMAMRRTVNDLKSDLWNLKSPSTWLYWLAIFILVPAWAIKNGYAVNELPGFLLGIPIGVVVGHIAYLTVRYISNILASE